MDLAYHGAQTDLHSQTILPEGLEGKRLKVSHQQNLPFEGLPACEGHHRIAILWIGSIPFSGLTNLNCTKMEVVKCAIRVRKSYLQDKPDTNLYILSAQLDCNLNFQMLSYNVVLYFATTKYFQCQQKAIKGGWVAFKGFEGHHRIIGGVNNSFQKYY